MCTLCKKCLIRLCVLNLRYSQAKTESTVHAKRSPHIQILDIFNLKIKDLIVDWRFTLNNLYPVITNITVRIRLFYSPRAMVILYNIIMINITVNHPLVCNTTTIPVQ